jgi:hypothetical protein
LSHRLAWWTLNPNTMNQRQLPLRVVIVAMLVASAGCSGSKSGGGGTGGKLGTGGVIAGTGGAIAGTGGGLGGTGGTGGTPADAADGSPITGTGGSGKDADIDRAGGSDGQGFDGAGRDASDLAGMPADTGAGGSGLTSSKRLIDLTDAEKGQMCDWIVTKAGGYGHMAFCDGGIPLFYYPDQASCVDDSASATTTPKCAATVKQMEDCANQTAPCLDAARAAPACAPVLNC